MEQTRGIEPPFQPWQGRIITVILRLLLYSLNKIILPQSKKITTLLIDLKYNLKI